MRKSAYFALLGLALVALASPPAARVVELRSSGLVPAFLPAGTIPVKATAGADFDGDGSLETLLLEQGQASIASNAQTTWQSPPAWKVDQARITDLDRDGELEAALLVWRPFRSWPVDQWLPHGGRIDDFHDVNGNSCHIVLIGWRSGRYAELWAGSALAEPIKTFAAADLNADGYQELVTLDGNYADSLTTHAGTVKVWEWNGFGFTVVSSLKGTINRLDLIQTGTGRILILLQ